MSDLYAVDASMHLGLCCSGRSPTLVAKIPSHVLLFHVDSHISVGFFNAASDSSDSNLRTREDGCKTSLIGLASKRLSQAAESRVTPYSLTAMVEVPLEIVPGTAITRSDRRKETFEMGGRVWSIPSEAGLLQLASQVQYF